MAEKVSAAVRFIEARESRREGSPRARRTRDSEFFPGMVRCRQAAAVLLAHVNVLLAVYAGGALVTAARLKWDPSIYLAVRQFFPYEYRVAAGMMAAAGFALLFLALLGVAALQAERARRVLLVGYAAALGAVMCAELAWCAWTARRVYFWLQSPPGQQVLEALELRKNLQSISNYFGRWFPFFRQVQYVVQEVEADLHSNVYVAAAAGALLALLQALAVLLAAALAACGTRSPRRARARSLSDSLVTTTTDASEKAPLRTAYRNGRIVIL